MKKKKKLFNNFSFFEIKENKRGKGRKPIIEITFNFELLKETKLLMMSKVEKVKEELKSEDWIVTEINLLLSEYREKEPYYEKIQTLDLYNQFIGMIQTLKEDYEIYGVLNQQLIRKALHTAFKKFKADKNGKFLAFLSNSLRFQCNYYMQEGKSLEQEKFDY